MKSRFPFRNEKEAKDAELKAAVDTMKRLPTIALLQTIETIINVLRERGKEIRDFDHKEKVVQQVRMIGQVAYFLAAKPEDDVEYYVTELEHLKENNRLISNEAIRLRKENQRLRKENERLMKQMEERSY